MLKQRSAFLALTVLLAAAVVADATAESLEPLLRQRGEAFGVAMSMSAASDSALAAFAAEHLASTVFAQDRGARFVQRMQETLAELGPVDRYSVQVLEGGKALFVFTRSAETGAWHNFQFRVLAEDEQRLQLVFRAQASEPMPRPSTPIADPATQRWLADFAASLEAQHPFSGAIVVRSGGQEVFSRIQGMADVERRLPVTRDTRFGMASGSKLFTAVAVLQLAQAGKLSLTDSLLALLPDFPAPEYAHGVTLRQLLTHTAGAGNYWDADYERAWPEISTLEQMLPYVLKHLGETPAGEFSYSNSGFLLLGLVVEAVSGLDYYDYVERHLCAPAGMARTGFPQRGQAADLARGYDPEMDAGAVKLGSYLPVSVGGRGSAAGGAASTVDDLLRFADALAGGVLLDAAHLELLSRLQVADGGAESGWSCGAAVQMARGVHAYGHGGSAPGCQFELKIYPGRDAVLVVMSNYNTIAAYEWAIALDALLRNGAP